MDGLIAVRATIALRGLRPGAEALVDPTDDYVQMCLDAGYLVAIEPDSANAVAIAGSP